MGLGRNIRSLVRKYWIDKSKHKYHFIHIPKNGGVSIRRTLALNKYVSLSEPYHYRYRDIVGTAGTDLVYFSVVRNPWRRTASRYMFGKQNAKSWPIDDPRRVYIETASFEAYVKDQRVLPIPEHPGQPWMGPLSSWFNQLEWLCDESGEVACVCLRLESLEKDLSQFLGQKVSIQMRNVTEKNYDYKDLYTDELIRIVADLFHEDIAYFGFDFSGGATRNTIGN